MLWMCIRIASVRQFKYTSTKYDFMEQYRKLPFFIILIPTQISSIFMYFRLKFGVTFVRKCFHNAYAIYTCIKVRFYGCKADTVQMKNCDIFLIFILYRLWVLVRTASFGSESNEYLQSIYVMSKNKKKAYPCKHQFYYIQVSFVGVLNCMVLLT